MKIIASASEMQQTALALRAAGKRLAFVPTMGNLHDGHLSLVRLAKTRADVVVLSIFVNPTQFGPNEDFAAYPRTFEADRALCEREGVDLIFHPSVPDMYPAGASVSVIETSLSRTLCGAARPGHFAGVCTVVAKLFNLVLPHVAVFGEKDAQQLRIIRRMVRDLRFPVEIVAGPTAREADGLARSSRNQYLTAEQRPQAVCLRRALDEAERRFAAGERDPAALVAAMRAVVARAPAAKIDYVEIVDDETLQPLAGPIARPALAALAVWVGQPRLIDNAVLRP
ncbi:MAG TPA: pantoate--beta-alanine ligase [Kiritimatiellia bacterium]|nr:pantoate--beta-alanine ligase [Kiritimatiellia bacterium]